MSKFHLLVFVIGFPLICVGPALPQDGTQQQRITDNDTTMRAVSRIFSARYFQQYGNTYQYEIPGDGTARVTSTNSKGRTQRYVIRRDQEGKCTYTMSAQDTGIEAAFIDFGYFTGKYTFEALRPNSIVLLKFWGGNPENRAICEQISHDGLLDGSQYKCLHSYSTAAKIFGSANYEREMKDAVIRAFTYIFANVCEPMQLPPY